MLKNLLINIQNFIKLSLKVNIKTKIIENPGYKGEIQMYPEEFLTECTNKKLL